MYRHIILVTLIPIKTGLDEAVLRDLAPIVDASRRLSGCLSFDLYRLAKEPNTIFLHETWDTQEAHKRYLQGPWQIELTQRITISLASPIQTWQLEEIG